MDISDTFKNAANNIDLSDLSEDDDDDFDKGAYISRAAPGSGYDPMSVEEYDEQQTTLTGNTEGNFRTICEGSVTTMSGGNCCCIGDIMIDLIYGERGKGAFGTVYEGQDKNTRKRVAVKKIRVANDQDVADVMTEIRNLERIPRHNNLVYMQEFHFTKPFYWIVMEYCDMGDLQQYFIKALPNLPMQADIMLQCARGLNHMHSLKIPVVHRDIKPANIMLKADEHGQPEVKITDFGLAKIVNLESDLAKTALLQTQAGTPGFMAPEFFAKVLYTKSVDIFALGLVFLSMIKFKEGDKYMIPTIENAREMKAAGQEMHLAHTRGYRQPELVSDSPADNPIQLAIKQLIREMACYSHQDRLRMHQVVKKLEKIQPAKIAPIPAKRKRDHKYDPKKEEKKGVAFKLLNEAAKEEQGRRGGGEERQLISMLEDQFAHLNTDHNPDEFQVNDRVQVDSNQNRVQQLHESLFGMWTDKLNAYLGRQGKLTKKTSFCFSVLFDDGKEWKFHPAVVKKVHEIVKKKKLPSVKKKYLRGDVVTLPDGFSLTGESNSKFLEQRAMVSKYDNLQNTVTLEFATGIREQIQADIVKVADMSGHVIEDGDMVIVSADRDQLKKLQRGAGGYQSGMENLLGKTGLVENLYDNNTARVQFKSEKKAWTLNIQALKLLFKAEDLMKMVVRK